VVTSTAVRQQLEAAARLIIEKLLPDLPHP
jgi:hypothetical protein